MKLKALFLTVFFVFLAGLIAWYIRDYNTVTTIEQSNRVFLIYVIILSVVCVLFLVIDTLIRHKIVDGYFKNGTVRNLVLISAFLMIIILPVTGAILGTESRLPNTENRKLTEKPSFQISNVIGTIKDAHSFFNDNFGLRKTWMNMNNLVKIKVFKISLLNEVVLGKDNWLFYKPSLDDTLGKTAVNQNELIKIRSNLERQTEYFKDRGIYYLIVVCPNKESIYPEYLPDNIGIIGLARTTIDRLMGISGLGSSINILDLREPVLKAKKFGQLYYRTDTHWNSLGSFIGYSEIIKNISKEFPDVIALTTTDYNLNKNVKSFSGDLAKMLSLQSILTEQTSLITYDKSIVPESSKLRKAVIFRDSFYNGLEPYVSANFGEIIDIKPKGKFDAGTLDTDPPDIVMLICVQRQFDYMQFLVNECLFGK